MVAAGGRSESAMPERYQRFIASPKLVSDGAGRIWLRLQARISTAQNRMDFWANNGRWEEFLTAYEGDHWRPAGWHISIHFESSARPPWW